VAGSAVSTQHTGRRFVLWLLEERIEEVQGPEAREKSSMRGDARRDAYRICAGCSWLYP
jgi:hypothetical protein